MNLNRYLHLYGRWVVILILICGAILVDKKYSCYKVHENFGAMAPVLDPEKTVWVKTISSMKELKRGRSVVQFQWYLPWGEEGRYIDVVLFGRVVALEGDLLEIRKGEVYVNGEPLDITYVKQKAEKDSFVPIVIPKGCVYILADQRSSESAYFLDSRMLGPIPFFLIGGVLD